mgnify:FL=1
MTRRFTDKQRRARIQPLFDYWTRRMGLEGSWLISWQLVTNLSDGRGVFARTHTESPYRKAFIRFDRQVLDSAPQAELEDAVVHELSHIILEEVYSSTSRWIGESFLYNEITAPLEMVCDRLAAIFVGLRYGKIRTPYNDQNLVV